MATRSAPPSPAHAEAALAFLVAAGADVAVADTPRNWLAPKSPQTAAAPARAATAPAPGATTPPQTPVDFVHPATLCTDVPALLALLDRFPEARQHPPLLFHGALDSRVWVLIDRPDHNRAHRETIDRMLAAVGMDWNGAALVSRLPWPRPGDIEPTADLLARFTPVINRLADLVPPTHVLALGQTAADIAGGDARLASNRGRWFDWHGARLLPTLHPRTMVDNKPLRAQAFEHLKLFRAELA